MPMKLHSSEAIFCKMVTNNDEQVKNKEIEIDLLTGKNCQKKNKGQGNKDLGR